MAKIHFRTYTTKQILLFPQRIDENIAEDDPVRLVNGLIDQLDLTSFIKLYKVAGYEHPDFATINRFRNRVKKEINAVFTQVVLLLAERGFISLDVEYIVSRQHHQMPNTTEGLIFSFWQRSRATLSVGSHFPRMMSLTRAGLIFSSSASFACVMPIS